MSDTQQKVLPSRMTQAISDAHTDSVSPALSFEAQAVGIPAALTERLRRGGVNLQFGWYDADNWQPNSFDAELPLIAAAGAGHVRLPMSFEVMFDAQGNIKAERYTGLLAFMAKAKAQGLAVIVDCHNTHFKNAGGDWNEDYMGGLRDANMRQKHVKALTELARRLGQDGDPAWYALQPANEPIFTSGDEGVWYEHQKKLIASMRAVNPSGVFFIMAHDWQGHEATQWSLNMTPFASDPLLIVDCHFYEPTSLSHCSYPGQANNCGGQKYPGSQTTWRGTQTWNKAFIENLLADLWTWADKHGRQLHFSEIGTTGDLAEDVRARYLGDIVSILRAHGVGYTAYEWHRNFGIKQQPQVVAAVFSGQVVTPPPPPPPPPPPVEPPPDTDIDALVDELLAVRAERESVLAGRATYETEIARANKRLEELRASRDTLIEQLISLIEG